MNNEAKARGDRIRELAEAIDELCKARAEHAVLAHECRHNDDIWPSEDEIIAAWNDVVEKLEEL